MLEPLHTNSGYYHTTETRGTEYAYLILHSDICTLSQEDFSHLHTPPLSCRDQSSESFLTRGEGENEGSWDSR